MIGFLRTMKMRRKMRTMICSMKTCSSLKFVE